MALSQSDLDNIDAAIASGKLSVRFGDRQVTYQTVDDLLKARNHIAEELATASNKPIRRQLRIVTTSGW